VSIVGYTNAGKSTLLNTLTHSRVLVENKLFATLDPTSRRLRFPRDFEVIITDTVGFIRDLPKDLLEAFAATLEELNDADLLLHVVDVSNPQAEEHMASVERILTGLELHHKPTILVFNKMDRVDDDTAVRMVRRHGGVAICARVATTLKPLILAMEERVEKLMAAGGFSACWQGAGAGAAEAPELCAAAENGADPAG
jgi:GTP-binding protein HflX